MPSKYLLEEGRQQAGKKKGKKKKALFDKESGQGQGHMAKIITTLVYNRLVFEARGETLLSERSTWWYRLWT